jgi:hypothetical protein
MGVAALALGGSALVSGLIPAPAGAARADVARSGPVADTGLSITQTWAQMLPDVGNPIATSSPNLAVLPGGPAVVVGDRGGNLWAFNLSTGADMAPGGGTPAFFHVNGPIDSTPSVGRPGGGTTDTIFFGVGNAADPSPPVSVQAVTPVGTPLWSFLSTNIDPSDLIRGVAAGVSIATIAGQMVLNVPTIGQREWQLAALSGAVRAGWPFPGPDGDLSTGGVGDIDWAGEQEWVDNGDSTAGIYNGHQYTDGSILRPLNPSGQQQCEIDRNQAGESSPALGEIVPSNPMVAIVYGTADYPPFAGASDTNKLFAVGAHCNPLWTASLNGTTADSPAIVNAMGNGQLQVAEGTNIGNGFSQGYVYLLNGGTGQPIWYAQASGAIVGSIVSVDPVGQGYQDLVVPTTAGVQIFDGRTGQLLATLGNGQAFQNSPLVTTDPNGSIGLTIAGYQADPADPSQPVGVISHFEISGSHGNLRSGPGHTEVANTDVLAQPGGWPMFHHDQKLTGNAGIPPPAACTAPTGTPAGYVMAGSDGSVYRFGPSPSNLPFCGSQQYKFLAQPMVGIASTHNGGGYWTVASDGGIFGYGNAGYYGSMGGRPLNQPIVGMAATADGKGYWLVARDGGMFAFGDAGYYGSMGGRPLNQPIVGMTATPNGKGYWLVASDGGLFAFGNAKYFGSMGGKPLNQPIVGMADDPVTGGYWMVARDGGIFAFNAPYHGSTGNIHLNQPIVAMEALPNGSGYRFVAADGGVFSFAAPYYGAMPPLQLTGGIVAMSGF